MNNLYQQITKDLHISANKKLAADDLKYHKYNGFKSYGIKAAELGRILKRYKQEIRKLSSSASFSLAKQLYQNRIEESVLAANFVLETNIHYFTKTKLNFLNYAANRLCSWSTTDDFCIDVLQPILLKYPRETLGLLTKWNTSKDIWKRRASVVAFVRKIGASGDFTMPALELCENLIWDKEDLIQKAVGWCLKDLMRGDRKTVLSYIKELRKQGAPATITLYAMRDLKGKQRADLLKIHHKTKANAGLRIGKGKLAGKGVYATRDFSKGDVVIQYNLQPLSKKEYSALPAREKMFVHTHLGQKMLYSEPERYVNHSKRPNTYQDLKRKQDIALQKIAKGSMITTDATKDDLE